MAAWTPEQWWSADVDKTAAERAFKERKLKFAGWLNRQPLFHGPVDPELVQALAIGQSPPPTRAKMPPEPVLIRKTAKASRKSKMITVDKTTVKDKKASAKKGGH